MLMNLEALETVMDLDQGMGKWEILERRAEETVNDQLRFNLWELEDERAINERLCSFLDYIEPLDIDLLKPGWGKNIS